MKCERKFNDRVEPGERTIAGPHLLDQDPAVAGPKQMHHAPGENTVSEPLRRLLDGGLLLLDAHNQIAATAQVFSAGRHCAAVPTGRPRYFSYKRVCRVLSGTSWPAIHIRFTCERTSRMSPSATNSDASLPASMDPSRSSTPSTCAG